MNNEDNNRVGKTCGNRIPYHTGPEHTLYATPPCTLEFLRHDWALVTMADQGESRAHSTLEGGEHGNNMLCMLCICTSRGGFFKRATNAVHGSRLGTVRLGRSAPLPPHGGRSRPYRQRTGFFWCACQRNIVAPGWCPCAAVRL